MKPQINDLILEYASDMAERLTAGDIEYKDMYVADGDTEILTEEAQDIFNEYYDQCTETFKQFAKAVLKA